jgi:hypothetical protein
VPEHLQAEGPGLLESALPAEFQARELVLVRRLEAWMVLSELQVCSCSCSLQARRPLCDELPAFLRQSPSLAGLDDVTLALAVSDDACSVVSCTSPGLELLCEFDMRVRHVVSYLSVRVSTMF